MVAGTSSCSCPTCKIVCVGRFTGCALVWAKSTEPVTIVPAPALASANDNGRDPRGDGSAIEPLEAAMATFMDPVEGARSTWLPGDPGERQMVVVTQLLTELQALPEAIEAAMTNALTRQHKLIVGEIRTALRQVLSEE